MKTKHIIINAFCLMLVAVMVVSPVAAKSEIIETTGMLGDTQTLSEGTTTYIAGNAHVRGLIKEYKMFWEDSRFIGVLVVTVNANLIENGDGPMWGTATIMGNGTFCEAVWNGMITGTVHTHHLVGNCTGTYQKVWIDFDDVLDVHGRFLLTKP